MTGSTRRQRSVAPGASWATDMVAQLGPGVTRDEVTVLYVVGALADLALRDGDGQYHGHAVRELATAAVMDEDQAQRAADMLVNRRLLRAMPGALGEAAYLKRYRLPDLALTTFKPDAT